MWRAKDTIGEEIWNTLFDDYSRATEGDRNFLNALEERLRALGITCVPSGRQIPADAIQAPLIFADLFLGATQDVHDVEKSLNKLKELLVLSPLALERLVPAVPSESLCQIHATSTPVAACPVTRCPAGFSQRCH
jgi:hypothetical protein